MKIFNKIYLFAVFISIAFTVSCGGGDKEMPKDNEQAGQKQETVNPMEDKGIGPVKEIKLDSTIDEAMAAEGKKLYQEKCTACHNEYHKVIGPAQAGVLKRRTPEWVMNMMLNPTDMTSNDPVARQLLSKYGTQMTNQKLTQDEARKILEYFRTLKEQ